MAAISAGVNVLVEKPIDVATGRADALIEAAEAAGAEVMARSQFVTRLAELLAIRTEK